MRVKGLWRGLAAVLPALCAMLAGGAGWACDTALLVIDAQNAYVRELDLTTVDGVHLVDRLEQVLHAAREAGLAIIYVQHLDGRFAWGSADLAVPEAVAPKPGDRVIWKSYPDAFSAAALKRLLAEAGIRRLLLCGLATSGCVDATVRGALRYSFETWVLADAHAGGGNVTTLSYYNDLWPGLGATVVASTEVDLSTFGCPAPGEP